MINKSASIKDNGVDSLLQRPLGNQGAYVSSCLHGIRVLQLCLYCLLSGGSSNQGISNCVVDNLSIHMIIASEHG